MKIMKSTLLQQKQFRNFFISDIISGFGVGLTTVGANWYVLEQTNSDSIVGTFLAINVLAGFLISPIAGCVTDKFTRRNAIIGTFLIRAVPLGSID
jgi:MFS family permease